MSKPKTLNGTVKSMKHIKINPISTSIELPKLAKSISTTATNKEKKTLKFESSMDVIHPLTAR